MTVSNLIDDLPLNVVQSCSCIIQSCSYQLDGAPQHCSDEVIGELFNVFEDCSKTANSRSSSFGLQLWMEEVKYKESIQLKY